MEFAELKQAIDKELKLEKPEFTEDSETTHNIGELELSTTQKLVFAVSCFRNKKYFDIRTWFQDDSGEWKPTKKGVHFAFEKFEDFEKLIESFSTISKLDQ